MEGLPPVVQAQWQDVLEDINFEDHDLLHKVDPLVVRFIMRKYNGGNLCINWLRAY